MESKVTHYGNGPLPEHLASAAYFTGDRQEWALPKAEALSYLDWCESKSLSVLGFEVWYPTTPGPTVVELGVGNVEELQRHATVFGSTPIGTSTVRWFSILLSPNMGRTLEHCQQSDEAAHERRQTRA
jgi:hypothetical protein